MRGVVSLAALRCRPAAAPFPERDLLIFLAFSVILATLVGQGLTLPFLIRAMGVVADRARPTRRPTPGWRRPRRPSSGSRSSRTNGPATSS